MDFDVPIQTAAHDRLPRWLILLMKRKGNMKTVLLDPADTVILLLDHQNGLFQTVTPAAAELGRSAARAATAVGKAVGRRRQT